MKQVRIFAKGNVDVHDSLHSCRIGDALVWNGINEVVRKQLAGQSIRLVHETYTRSDALLAAAGQVPASLAGMLLPIEPYSAAMQFSNTIFDSRCDAIILTIQPDVCTALFRHQTEGYLFYPNNLSNWTPEARAWLRSDFVPLGLLDGETTIGNLGRIIDAIRQARDVPILVYNVSSFVPGEVVHCLQGLDETFPRRARRFNAALETLSEQTGISIVDVETIVARAGADRVKLDALHLTADGYRLVAEEVVRVLCDLGVLEGELA